jgi:DNA-binding helix-hairpin-helix protein with protein kinase domain
LHDICQAAFWNSRPEKKCPRCETAWEGKAFVGQRVITTTEDYLKGKRRSGGVRTSRQAEDEEVVAVDEEEAEDDE